MTTHTEAYARLNGYVSITTPFEAHEKHLLEKAVAQMEGTDYIVVLDQWRRPEIYRRKTQLRFEK